MNMTTTPIEPVTQAIVAKIYAQSDCLEKYAESHGFAGKPVPSVFHLQAAHFRAYANELEAALTRTIPAPSQHSELADIERAREIAGQVLPAEKAQLDSGAYDRTSTVQAALIALRQPPSDGMRGLLADDPDNICTGIPDAAIEAGVAAWDNAREEMQAREQALDPENHNDWDEGMVVAAIFKAIARAALTQGKPT